MLRRIISGLVIGVVVGLAIFASTWYYCENTKFVTFERDLMTVLDRKSGIVYSFSSAEGKFVEVGIIK